MSVKITRPSLDPARVQDIARQIRGAVTPFIGANNAKTEASEIAQSTARSEVSLRESIMVSLADMSRAGQWSESEVAAAAAKAAGMSNNDSEKALATFIGETRRAMHPRVRAHVPHLVDLRDTCWASETEMRAADKNAPTPLRKAFARQYHMLIAMFSATADGHVFEDVNDVSAFAEGRDPDLDLDKVKARLDKIREQLAAFYHDWPVDDIQVCVDALNAVDKNALRASRAAGGATTTVVEEKPQAVVSVKAEVSEAAPVVDTADILDEVLGN